MSTADRLAAALEQAGAPAPMVARARANYYDEWKGPLATPLMQLVADANAAGLRGFAERVAAGEFDATVEEGDAWAASPEGQATMSDPGLMGDAVAALARARSHGGVDLEQFATDRVMEELRASSAAPLPPRPDAYGISPERVVDAIDMLGRTGCAEVEFGYLDDDVPVHLARWWARVRYKGATLIAEDQPGPVEALEELVRRVTTGALCRRCGLRIHWGAVSRRAAPAGPVCAWTRVAGRWEPSCPPEER